MWRILPSSCSSFRVPTDSSSGTFRSGACSWYTSIRSSRRRSSEPRQAARRCSGRPSSTQRPGPGRTFPPFVAITSPSGYGYSASAISSSLTFGPYESAVSISVAPSSTARLSTASDSSWSRGGPQIPSPVIRIAP